MIDVQVERLDEGKTFRMRIGTTTFDLDRRTMLREYEKILSTEILLDPGMPVTLSFEPPGEAPVTVVIPFREVECVILRMKRAIESESEP